MGLWGFGVWYLGVWGAGFRDEGLGFRAPGSGLRAPEGSIRVLYWRVGGLSKQVTSRLISTLPGILIGVMVLISL